MKLSNLFTIDIKDVANGLFVAVSGGILGAIYSAFVNAGTYDKFYIDWHVVLFAGVMSGLAYLNKRYFSNDNGDIMQQ